MTTARLPFVCSACGLRYGDQGNGPSFLTINGDASNISVAANKMQCPRCGTMNRQALPDGTYSVRDGKWYLLHRIAREVLAADASRDQYEELIRLIQLAQTNNERSEKVAANIEHIEPFRQIAQIIREHPDRSLAILGIILTVLFWLIPPPADWGAKPSAPAPISKIANLSPAQREELARDIANDLANKDLDKSIGSHKPQRAPGRNEPCHCGSGIKYKKCCGDPRKR